MCSVETLTLTTALLVRAEKYTRAAAAGAKHVWGGRKQTESLVQAPFFFFIRTPCERVFV